MSLKKARERVEKRFAGATVEDDSTTLDYSVQIEAPPTMEWGNGVHSIPVHWFAGGNKADFWKEVYRIIDELEEPFECEGCYEPGVCDYWINLEGS